MNYTDEGKDGRIDISRAIAINEQFETSKHFWGYLVGQGVISNPGDFIRRVPHMSFVQGGKNQEVLRKRHAAMTTSHLFENMEFTTDHAVMAKWAPLLLQGRPVGAPLGATRMKSGTDVNYSELTQRLIENLVSLDGVELATNTKVCNITRDKDRRWKLSLDCREKGKSKLRARFIFIGAGGGALPLLQKSGIPEGKGYGGFPVSGQFLVCRDQAIVEQHAAKVYGQAAVGAPLMSMPHLDTRVIGGHKSLLFGPFAGFSSKFLKTGSNLDLFKSVKLDNLMPMLAAGGGNLPLTKYLINECRKTHEDR